MPLVISEIQQNLMRHHAPTRTARIKITDIVGVDLKPITIGKIRWCLLWKTDGQFFKMFITETPRDSAQIPPYGQ